MSKFNYRIKGIKIRCRYCGKFVIKTKIKNGSCNNCVSEWRSHMTPEMADMMADFR